MSKYTENQSGRTRFTRTGRTRCDAKQGRIECMEDKLHGMDLRIFFR